MNYINTQTLEVVSRTQLESLHMDPLVLFPYDVGDESLAEFGFANVFNDEYPVAAAQQSIQADAVVFTDGKYLQTWKLVDVPVTADQVDAERDRRMDAGVTFDGLLYQSAAGDRENIAGAAQMAFMAMVSGAQPGDLRWHGGDSDFQWIAADNTRVTMDAPTVVSFGKTAAAYKQALVFAGSDLKAHTLIPVDYTDDKWWV